MSRSERFAAFLLAALTAVGGLTACGDSTAPRVPAAVVIVSGSNSQATVGQPVTPSPTFRVNDDKGAAIKGVAFTATASGGSLSGVPLSTQAGPTSIGMWTLGSVAGQQSVTVSVAGLPSLVIDITTLPGPPASTAAVGPLTATGTPGQASPLRPSIKVLDSFGNPVPGVSVSVQVTGGGTVRTAAPVTDATGVASTGTWTLGAASGNQTVTMSAGSLPPVTFTAVIASSGSAMISPVSGTFQIGTPNGALPVIPLFKVASTDGTPLVGQSVQFAVIFGGGHVTTTGAVTNALGQASPGVWTLGPLNGTQILQASAGGAAYSLYATAMAPATGGFSLDVRYIGTPPAVVVQTAVAAAASRIGQEIASRLTDITLNGMSTAACIPGGPVVNEVVHNMILFVSVGPIDGAGSIIAQSGPCLVRPTTGLPVVGTLLYDEADLATSINNGTVTAVFLHEMHHTLGYGVLWDQTQAGYPLLISGEGTSNPFYLGAAGNNGYLAIGGTSPNGIPIENTGQPGTRDSHWRESVFQTEVLTGFVNVPTNPLSSMSILALADFGYSVNVGAADAYTVPAPGQLRDVASLLPAGFEERLLGPLFTLDASGHAILLGSGKRR